MSEGAPQRFRYFEPVPSHAKREIPFTLPFSSAEIAVRRQFGTPKNPADPDLLEKARAGHRDAQAVRDEAILDGNKPKAAFAERMMWLAAAMIIAAILGPTL